MYISTNTYQSGIDMQWAMMFCPYPVERFPCRRGKTHLPLKEESYIADIYISGDTIIHQRKYHFGRIPLHGQHNCCEVGTQLAGSPAKTYTIIIYILFYIFPNSGAMFCSEQLWNRLGQKQCSPYQKNTVGTGTRLTKGTATCFALNRWDTSFHRPPWHCKHQRYPWWPGVSSHQFLASQQHDSTSLVAGTVQYANEI